VTAFLILMLVWFVAYLGLFIWLLARKSRIVGGGVALFALSLVPLIYGRWTTPSDWHDHVLMAVYYLPTFLAAFLALIVIVVGLVIKIRQALLTRGGA
jgi:hypothetical protein